MIDRMRQFVLVLITIALTGGASAQLAHSMEYVAPMMMAGMPCDMMISDTGVHDDKPMPPCKGMTSDCMKQMGCVTDAALPARTLNPDIAVSFSGVDYWLAWSQLADFERKPEPLPPRTT